MQQLVGGISYMGNSFETETASEYGSVKEGILRDFDYDRFREAGIPIGSGEVESAHRAYSLKAATDSGGYLASRHSKSGCVGSCVLFGRRGGGRILDEDKLLPENKQRNNWSWHTRRYIKFH